MFTRMWGTFLQGDLMSTARTKQMPTEYDSNIVQSYAAELYKQAQNIIVATAVVYGLYSFLFSAVLSTVIFAYLSREHRTDEGNSAIFSVLIFTAIGVAVGVSEGRKKACHLKLEAQQLLYQRQIERNTHTRADGSMV